MQEGEYIPTPSSVLTKFRIKDANAPSNLYLNADDVVTVMGQTNKSTSETIQIQARFLRAMDGAIVWVTKTVALTSLRTNFSGTLGLGEGYLLGLSISAGLASLRGQTHVRVFLVKGVTAGTAQNSTQLLAQGYVTTNVPTTWPGASLEPPVSGQGLVGSALGVSSPAAGAEFIATVPTNARWRFISLQLQLAASATVANRLPTFCFGTGQIPMAGALVAVTAGQTVAYCVAPGVTSYTDAAGNIYLPGPSGVIIPAAGTIRTKTTALQAGDQWTVNFLIVEEWLEF